MILRFDFYIQNIRKYSFSSEFYASWLNVAAAAVETIISPPLSRNGNTAAFPPKEERYSKLSFVPSTGGLGFSLKNVLLKLCGETV